MDFDAAIVAHTKWKGRIRKAIAGDEVLDPTVVAKDNQCDLGRWLEAAPAAERQLPEFAALTESHARFHRVAADTLRQAARLPKSQAEQLLTGNTPFGAASSECVRAITALRDREGSGVR